MPSEVIHTSGDPWELDGVPESWNSSRVYNGDHRWYDGSNTTTSEVQTPMSKRITKKQLEYLQALVTDLQARAKEADDKLGLPAAVEHAKAIDEKFRQRIGDGTMTSERASEAITHIIKVNKRLKELLEPVSSTVSTLTSLSDPVTADGMYRASDGDIYKVQESQSTGHLYAKKLTIKTPPVVVDDVTVTPAEIEFIYAPGALRKLTAGDRMTIEQAKEFGALYGTCCRCGRTLTDEGSIEAGIGPICAGYFE